jgi:hypothetical protein
MPSAANLTSIATASELRRHTRHFLKLHWPSRSPKQAAPRWEQMKPTHRKPSWRMGGCYAVVNYAGAVVYVGLALTPALKDGGRGGIERRLLRHVLKQGALSKGTLVPKRDAWTSPRCGGIEQILLLPFPKCSYLAAALEVFLIEKLGARLPMNKARVPKEMAEATEDLKL